MSPSLVTQLGPNNEFANIMSYSRYFVVRHVILSCRRLSVNCPEKECAQATDLRALSVSCLWLS